MRFLLMLATLAVAVFALVANMPAAETAQLNRDLLWATVRLCVAAERSIGLAIPCQSVDLGAAGRPGTALLRVPGTGTHYVLMPIGDIAGLESPHLQGSDGVAIFQSAWAARAQIVAAAPRHASLSDIGVAINAPLSRSQDHLHIHIDCVRSAVQATLRQAEIDDNWSWLAPSLLGRRYIARHVPAERIATFNPFAALVEFLPQQRLIAQSSLAAVPAGDGRGLILLADVRPQSWSEGLLDHACRR